MPLVAPLTALPPTPLAVGQYDHGALVEAALSAGDGSDVDLPIGSTATFVAVERPGVPLRQRRAPRTIAGFCLGGGALGANVVTYAFTLADTATPGTYDWSIRLNLPTGEVYTFAGGALEILPMTAPLAFPSGTGMFVRCTDGGANDGKVVELCGSSDGCAFTTPKLSARVITWQVVTSGTAAPLASAYQTTHAYAKGAAFIAHGNTYVVTTAGDSATSGTGPSTTGAGIAVGPNTLIVKGYAGALFPGGFTLTNIDGLNDASVGDADAQYGPLPHGFGGGPEPVSDPTAIYVVAAAGTPIVTVKGYQ